MRWFIAGFGIIFGLSHVALIGLLVNRNQVPVINLPVGDYTSYSVEAGTDGYKIDYASNDPKVMTTKKDVDKSNGFFGIGGKTSIISEKQYTMSQSEGEETMGKLTAKKLECIKAEGGGQSTGAVVGASMAATATPALTAIPFVGWVAAGWATMFGQKQGAEVGGEIAKSLNDCDDIDTN